MNTDILKYIAFGAGFGISLLVCSVVLYFIIKKGILHFITFAIDKLKNVFSFLAEELRTTLKTIFLNPVEALLLMQGFKIFQFEIKGHYELLEVLTTTVLLAVVYLLKDKINPSDISFLIKDLEKRKNSILDNEKKD